MPAQKVIALAIPRPLEGLFTYKISEELSQKVRVGSWVKVPFGSRITHAFVVEPPVFLSACSLTFDPSKLKEVLEVCEDGWHFPEDVWKLCHWARDYYLAPLGEILGMAAPSYSFDLSKKKEKSFSSSFRVLELSCDQKKAFEFLELQRKTQKNSVALLHGVTGSGKTEIYIELAQKTLAEKKGVLILVPEIALTPQLYERFQKALGVPVALWHSAVAMGQKKYHNIALREGKIQVVVGARSSVFAPIADLGLVVVDEEHDPTYKQEERFRYHARDLAMVRASYTQALVVLGSATPSLETRERVRQGRYTIVSLKERVGAQLPTIELINIKDAFTKKTGAFQVPLARQTLEAIKQTLASHRQVMIYLNRRGFAAFLRCQQCQHVCHCFQCSVTLAVHKRENQLKCHACGFSSELPDHCPQCNKGNLRAYGMGTERLQENLERIIPEAKILRLDRDQLTSHTRLNHILESFKKGEANILLGTQMLVKGHDFPGVTLVVVVTADALFYWPDFRASERALQILTQVSGRAGRAQHPGKVLIQTYDPDHPVLQVITGKLSEENFLEEERSLRSQLCYAPFGRLARLRFESRDNDCAFEAANQTADYLKKQLPHEFLNAHLLGPGQAFLKRIKNTYRWDILLKAKDRLVLQPILEKAVQFPKKKNVSFSIDVDPYAL